MSEVIKRVSLSEQKREQFEKAWPQFFNEYLQRTVRRMNDIDSYMHASLEKMKKA